MKYQYGIMILEYYFHIGFNKKLIIMIYLEGRTTIIQRVYTKFMFISSFRWANAHTDSLGEVDVISDAEV